MKKTVTSEMIAKLPEWARERMDDLKRQREVAIRTLNESIDKQTVSPFFYEYNPCTGEATGPVSKRVYVQAHRITCEYAGVEVSILAFDGRLEVSWGGMNSHSTGEIAMIPYTFQKIRLVAKKNMR